MLLEFILRHDADEVLEGSIITTFGLTKWQDKVGLIPPGVKELSTPIRVPEEEHTCTTIDKPSVFSRVIYNT